MSAVNMDRSRLVYAAALLALSLLAKQAQCATTTTLKDIFNLNTQTLQRVPRDNKYYLSRYGSGAGPEDGVGSSRTIKPEESPEARQGDPGAVEKRCTRCNEYDRYDRYDRYDSRSRYYDDRYDTKRSRYPDYDYDRYDGRGYDRYDKYDSRGGYDRYDSRTYDRYDRDRYDPRDRYYDRYDRYESRDRYQDRGIGYDNRGYDYRGYDRDYDRYGSRPETYGARPNTYGSGYASSWNYGGGRGDDYYKDRGGYRDQGYGGGGGGGYRTRDPYDVGYRGTSYLYGRPSSTTTTRPSSQDDNSVTDSPQQTNSPSG